jgi:hypothetical protein
MAHRKLSVSARVSWCNRSRHRPRVLFHSRAAFAAVVCVLHAGEIEIFFPVRSFFLQGSWTVADLDPANGLICAEARFAHVAQVFAFGDGSLAKRFTFNGVKQVVFTTGLYAGSNQITHFACAFAMAIPPEQAWPGTGRGCAYRSTGPPACRRGHIRNFWGCLRFRAVRSPCDRDQVARDR